jgi:nucleotide-binding universal stress UspA family protein
MLKRILVPLDPSPYTDAAIELACFIAKKRDAEITGLVMLDIPGIEKSIGPMPVGAIHYAEVLEKKKIKEAEDRIRILLEKFKKKCMGNGIRYNEAKYQGSPSERIIKESAFYDAIIVGMRTYFDFETEEESFKGHPIEKILGESITPIYAVPKDCQLHTAKDHKLQVLIAYDGSMLSARAMQRFAQLALPEILEVTVITSQNDKDQADYLLDHVQEYLVSHGFQNVKKIWTRDNIIHAVDKEYLEQTDIFVVGAHSKRGLFDFIIGSLTRHLLAIDKKPVIIGQ